MASEPPSGSNGGSAILLLAILAVIVAGLLFWGWSTHSTRRPAPAATGIPRTIPDNPPSRPH
jgi:hypothetical protein